MGKYTGLQADVFSILDSAEWKATNIKTHPANFLAIDAGTEFIRVDILATGSGINFNSVSGLILIDIFTPAGVGPKRPAEIADILDTFFVGKQLKTASGAVTQLLRSSFASKGNDKDNPNLFRSAYAIPFNYFGVQ